MVVKDEVQISLVVHSHEDATANPGIVLRVEASGVLTGSDSFDDLSVGLTFRDLSLGHLLDGLEVGNLRLGEYDLRSVRYLDQQ